MFNLFKKKSDDVESDAENGFDPDSVTTYYEGEVLSPEYAAQTLNRDDHNDQDYPYHAIYPDGVGKITYKVGDEIIESYEGEFDAGQYQGKGKLTRRGEVFEGTFEGNKFVE